MRLGMMLMPVLAMVLVRLPAAAVGADYDSGPIAPAAVMGCASRMPYYRLLEGPLPEGVELSPVGRLRGRPAHAGTYQMRMELDNGCMRTQVAVTVPVLARPILASFDTEVELSEDQPQALLRVSSDQPGLAYAAVASAPWLRVKPLMGRTPRPGEALTSDLVTLEVDRAALEPEANPDGPTVAREATVSLECFRCRGMRVRVILR